MSNIWKTLGHRWRDGVNFLLGIWLIASPWVLQYTGQVAPAWYAYGIGVIVAVAAAAAIIAFQQWEEWVNVVLGASLIVSPWVLGASTDASIVWNHILVGAAVGGLALWSALEHRELAPQNKVRST